MTLTTSACSFTSFEPVRDDDHRRAGVRQVPQHRVERGGFSGRQDRGGLVEDQRGRLARERPDDRHTLSIADPQVTDRYVPRERRPYSTRVRFDVRSRGLAIERTEPAHRLGSKHDVLERGEGADEREMLLHERHPTADRLPRRVRVQPGAVDLHVALVRYLDTGRHLQESGLARAVLADHRVDASSLERQRHVRHRADRAEAFGQAVERQESGHRSG